MRRVHLFLIVAFFAQTHAIRESQPYPCTGKCPNANLLHAAIAQAEKEVKTIYNVIHEIKNHTDSDSPEMIKKLKASLLSLVGTHLNVVQQLSGSNPLDGDVASHFPIHYQKITALKQPANKGMLGSLSDAVLLGLGSYYNRGTAYLATVFKEKVEATFNTLDPNVTTIEDDARKAADNLLEQGSLDPTDTKQVERIQQAIRESASTKRDQIATFSHNMEQCLTTHSCTTTTMPLSSLETPQQDDIVGGNVYAKKAGVGGYGGECTCPDGQVYQVGDNNNGCSSLACYGGVISKPCSNGGIPESSRGMSVNCATQFLGQTLTNLQAPPEVRVHSAMQDVKLSVLEDKLVAGTQKELAGIHADATECSKLDRGVTTVVDLERMAAMVAKRWGVATSNTYKDSLPWADLLSSMQPCEHRACAADYDSFKLEAFKRLTLTSSSTEAIDYHANLATQQDRVSRGFELALSLKTTSPLKSVEALQTLGRLVENNTIGSCECTAALDHLAKNVYTTLKSAAQRGDAMDAFHTLLENSAASLHLPTKASSWFTPAYKHVVACARANVDVDLEDQTTSIEHCRTQIVKMRAETPAEELHELAPYNVVVDELPLRTWCAAIHRANETNNLSLYIEHLQSIPTVSSGATARTAVLDLVKASKATAWKHVPALLTAEAAGTLDRNDSVNTTEALERIQQKHLTPLFSIINTLEEVEGHLQEEQTLAKGILATVRQVVEEALCVLREPQPHTITNAVHGTHIHSAMMVSPKQAKYGGVVVQPCSEDLALITIPANIIADCKPTKTLVFPGHGLPSLEGGGKRGDRTIVVTIDGYIETARAPEGSLELIPALNSVHRQASEEIVDALGVIHMFKQMNTADQQHKRSSRHQDHDQKKAAQQQQQPPPSRDTKIAAYGTLLNGIRAFIPLAQLKPIFCSSMTATCVDDAAFKKAYNSAKRPSMAHGEFKHEDRGGSPLKSAFALNLVPNLLFPKLDEQEHLDNRRMYDGLAARLIPEWQKWDPKTHTIRASSPPSLSLSSSSTGEDNPNDPTKEIERMIEMFNTAFPEYKKDPAFAVPPVSAEHERHRADFDGTGSHRQSHVKLVPGGGGPNGDYPWRGDLMINITVDNLLDATINGHHSIIEKMTVPWDLQVLHTLSSYDVYAGTATLHLRHPDGNSYHMVVHAPSPSDGSRGRGGNVFEAGKHVFQISNLGNPKGSKSKRRGDLYLVLISNLGGRR